jgi:transcriptional regulator with XRE-family HTH domain
MNQPSAARIKDWASYVRRFRDRHGLTQEQLAELLTAGQENEVYASTIQRWEYGHRTPPPYLKLALRDVARELTAHSDVTNQHGRYGFANSQEPK